VDHGTLAARLNEPSGLRRLVTGRRIIRPTGEGPRPSDSPPGNAWREPSSGWTRLARWVS
jgi:hypothetical protein